MRGDRGPGGNPGADIRGRALRGNGGRAPESAPARREVATEGLRLDGGAEVDHAGGLEMNDDLPILDISGFHLYQQPGQFFAVFDQQSAEEDAALQRLLGVPELIQKHSTKVRKSQAKMGKKAVA